MALTLKQLIDLKEVLSTDSISTTRLTNNSNFSKLRQGLSALIDTLQVNEGPNVVVDSVKAINISADSFSSPENGSYLFHVNTNGEITAKSILSNVVVETPRLRLQPDPTLIAFQPGEVRWSGIDFVGWNGTQWISFTAGASLVLYTGPLVINQLYTIVTYGPGDDFTNVGASSNASGVQFVATGGTPTTWTNGSILSSGSGEVNTTSNLGIGAGLALPKVAANLPFKSIGAGTGVTLDLITDPNTIIINSTAASGYSGFSGINGTIGVSGTSGFSGGAGVAGASGYSGISGQPGTSGYSGIAASGFSGYSGTATSGYSGASGISGQSGFSGIGQSGFSGMSGDTGNPGATGGDGLPGPAGAPGTSGFSGYSGEAGAPVLGPAEDGSYLDGFWTDLTPSTPVGTFADRVNEILLALLPPPSPNLSDWSQLTLALSVPGKLSFDTSNPIASYNPADGATPPVFVDQTFVTSGKRLGITQQVGGTKLSGILNSQVLFPGPGTPFPAYPALSFGDAEKGTIRLYLNGTELVPKAIDLTSTPSAIDTSSAGTLTGMSVSTQGTVVFPNGTPLASFKYRTGTWTFQKADLSLGYNFIQIKHHVSISDIRTLAGFEVTVDGDTTATSFSGESTFNPVFGSPKKLSGIEYHQAGTLQYNLTINNAYRNTYSTSATAVSHTGTSNSYGVLLTAASQALAANLGNEGLSVTIVGKVATLSSPGKRVINGPLGLTTTVLRTVQATNTSTGSSLAGFLVDNVAATSTSTFEGFDDENYRLNTNSNFNLVTDVTSAGNLWDSIQSLNDGSAGHTTGLQVIDGKLIYPGANVSYPFDFRTSNIVHGSTFNDGGTGGAGRNYTGLAGTRSFYRKFQQISPTTGNFVMTIAGSGGTFVPLSTGLTGTNIHVEVKGPSQTGWMDAYADFITANWADGNGARSASGGAGRAFGTAWGITIGTKSTSATGGYMLVRITVASTFTGSFDSITFTFA